jgi:hypothetical protein
MLRKRKWMGVGKRDGWLPIGCWKGKAQAKEQVSYRCFGAATGARDAMVIDIRSAF